MLGTFVLFVALRLFQNSNYTGVGKASSHSRQRLSCNVYLSLWNGLRPCPESFKWASADRIRKDDGSYILPSSSTSQSVWIHRDRISLQPCLFAAVRCTSLTRQHLWIRRWLCHAGLFHWWHRLRRGGSLFCDHWFRLRHYWSRFGFGRRLRCRFLYRRSRCRSFFNRFVSWF
jgi:hypothetical protein